MCARDRYDLVDMHIRETLKTFRTIPALGLSLLIILGLYFSPGAVDALALKSGTGGFLSSNKLLRVITVGIAGAVAFILLNIKKGASLGALFKGNLAWLTLFAFWALFSVVFSPLKSLTVFKGGELVIACMLAALLLCSANKPAASVDYMKGIFWIYVVSTFSALLELMIVGSAGHKALVGMTPLLDTMMQSRFPPMVGNALGFLGALSALFGVYLFDATPSRKFVGKAIAVGIVGAGVAVLFLSYTRSVLVFFGLAVLCYSLLEKKYGRAVLLVLAVIGMLLVGSVREAVFEHMRRGATDQQISTLSGRLQFWGTIFSRDPLYLVTGGGFATGTLFQDYNSVNKKVFAYGNAHNSVAEIASASGLIGVGLWLGLGIRVFFQLLKSRRRLKISGPRSDQLFNSFVISLFLLSALRTLMNSTFVYVDYFFFVSVALLVYGQVYGAGRSPRKVAMRQRPALA